MLKAATRRSALALAQAGLVAAELNAAGHPTELVTVVSEGDVNTCSLAEIGGQGVFTAAVTNEVLERRTDFAIHSLKDLPTSTDPRVAVAAVPRREDPRDVLVTRVPADDLPATARIGTGSLRRRVQLRHWRPSWTAVDIRGNVDTRLGRVREAELDGVLLAAAGLNRLGLTESPGLVLTPIDIDAMTPAVGQGALGLECLVVSDAADALATVNDPASLDAVTVERMLLARLKGGCQVPFAAHVADDTVRLMIAEPEGPGIWRRTGTAADAMALFDDLIAEAGPGVHELLD